ncbi:hypothetical protein [Xylanibacter muris]|uniref:DUF4878 domain-containing protein n=1 Tax=Xylanibacter muris TaxID=2736290 RepID=A0ABX2ASA7_9BACT|nr:hypothetical protein [Xylanibacter muris]NPD93089.1 hypothetical protein [Xylanibacter muris]
MMRLFQILCIIFAVFAVSCKEETSPEELAAKAAKIYYEHLFSGNYSEYLSGLDGTDSIPENYREQLLVNVKQFVVSQKAIHNGIGEVRVLRSQTDSVAGYTNVFLLLCFGDSVKEEVVVPMVERDGVWRMK